MKFGSIKEYFYKLYNYCLLLVLVPPLAFVFLYFVWPKKASYSIFENEDMTETILIIFFVLIITELTIVHLLLKRQFRQLRKEVALGVKMDRYAGLALMRIIAISACATLVSAAFFLTGNIWTAGIFALLLMWMWLQWPSPKKFCNDLSVRNDERELLLKSRDAF